MIDNYFVAISIITACAAVIAWLASRGRQPIIVAYFICGAVLGPHLLGVIGDIGLLEQVSRLGVTLLLFLAGMVLHPDRLFKYFKSAVVVTLGASVSTWILVYLFLRLWGFDSSPSHMAALALMLSSTILVVKLLPTTTLHQKHMGAVCIAILIAEDMIAIGILLILGAQPGETVWHFLLGLPVKTAAFIALAVMFERYVLRWMMRKSDRYNEVLIMLCLGWCLGLSVLAELIGLSYEVGAFIAGVVIARCKIALVLSEQLKPLRDFFLMFFFFVLGARFDFVTFRSAWLAALLLSLLIVLLRPLYLWGLLRLVGESADFSREAGIRLGQASEFALIITAAALSSGRLSDTMAQIVQLTTIITMIVSSYYVVFSYPTPIGIKDGLQKD